MSKILYFLRHSQTLDSELGINGSRTDTPLSKNGLLAAKELVAKLSTHKYDLIIISPLQRAIQTIKPFLDSLDIKPEIITESLSTERNLGLLTNSIKGDGQVQASITASGKSKTEWTPPHGESIADVYQRAQIVLDLINQRPENSILICGHQVFLRCLELLIKGKPLNDDYYYSDTPPLLNFGELREIILN